MENALRIRAVGDISMGDHPVCIGHGMRSTFRKRRDEVLGGVADYLRDSDITVANLETVASNIGLKRRWLPSIEMRGEPESLRYLKNAGIGLVGVANNHAMQHGEAAFLDCLSHLDEQGIDYIGVDIQEGQTKAFPFNKDGAQHTFFAVSLRPEEWQSGSEVPYSLREDVDSLISEVAALRAQCNGFLVCSIHWGLELLNYPGPNEVMVGRALIDAGVDVVLGHHSHLLWPTERYKHGLIFYSLGNFVFDLWSPETKLSVIADITLNKGEPPAYTFIPVVVGDDFLLRDANQKEKNEILERLAEKPHDKDLSPEEYKRRHQAAVGVAKPIKYKYFIRNFYRYSPNFLFQSIFRTFLRRLTGN